MDASYKEQEQEDLKFDFAVWKRVFSHLGEGKKILKKAFIVAIFLGVIEVGIPYFITYFMKNAKPEDFKIYAPIYAVLVILFMTCIYFFIRFCGRIQATLSYNLRKAAFIKLQELPFEYFDRKPLGWIMARMTSDAAKLAHALSWALVDMVWSLFVLSFVIIIMFFANPLLALCALATAPVILLFSIYFRKKMLRNSRAMRSINSRITASFAEGISGANTTKTLTREEANTDEFTKLTFSYRSKSIRATFVSATYSICILIMAGLSLAAVYYAGSIGAIGKDVETMISTASQLVLFIALVDLFFEPLQQLSRIMMEFQEGQASAERIMQLIDETPSLTDSDSVIAKYGTIFEPIKENFEDITGDIEFKDVNFMYSTGEVVLDTFNLTIPKGTSVAFVGETGAGKSTIVNLMCRFYEPTNGTILIDGIDYKERSQTWLHDKIGYVLQSPLLFSGSIMENIRYGRLDATDEEIIEAAKLVGVHDFIMRLDKGYETNVGEGGGMLSVGEKQLISFARAIIRNPAILILDEATSSIDTETELVLQGAMDKLLKDRTCVAIAHRLSTIVKYDLIIVLKKGKIVEKGSHKELMMNKGYYYNLFTSQFENEVNTLMPNK